MLSGQDNLFLRISVSEDISLSPPLPQCATGPCTSDQEGRNGVYAGTQPHKLPSPWLTWLPSWLSVHLVTSRDPH